jgi:hypothetical protein
MLDHMERRPVRSHGEGFCWITWSGVLLDHMRAGFTSSRLVV